MATEGDNLTQQLIDKLNAYAVSVLRTAAGMNKDVQAALDKLENQLIADVRDVIGKSDLTPLALRSVLATARDTINAAYGGITDMNLSDLQDVAKAAMLRVSSMLTDVVGLPLIDVSTPASVLNKLALNTLINGATSAEWWSHQSTLLQQKFTVAMRLGMSQGEGIADLTRRIMGTRDLGYSDALMNVPRNQAEAIVRTSAMAVSNGARLAAIMQNADIVKGVQWVATLDNRTTIICIGLNGLQWKLPESGNWDDYGDYVPIGHDKEFPGPTAHWNCRSTQVPVLLSLEELAGAGVKLAPPDKGNFDTIFKQKLADQGFTDEQIAQITGSMDGQAGDPGTLEDWLGDKSKAYQDDVLGDAAAQQFRQGDLVASDLTNQSNRPLTPEELVTQAGGTPTGEDTWGRTIMNLLNADVVSQKDLQFSGINNAQMITLDDDSKAIFKAAKDEQTAREGVQGSLGVREVANADIAHLLGMDDLVPPTVTREINGEEGSLQAFIAKAKEGGMPAMDKAGNADLARAAAWDYFTGNSDRHAGNWLLKDGKLVLIDNGYSFPWADSEIFSQLMEAAIKRELDIPAAVQDWEAKWPDIQKYLKEKEFTPKEIRAAKDRLENLTAYENFRTLYDNTEQGDLDLSG